MANPLDQLHPLAELYGVLTSYYDVTGQVQSASPEALLQVLAAMGASLTTIEEAPQALRERRQQEWQRILEPVTVAWDGGPAEVAIRLPAKQFESSLRCALELESGEKRDWTIDASRLAVPADGLGDSQDVRLVETGLEG